MSDELVHLERADGGVAVLRLDHPPMNALSQRLLERFAELAEKLAEEPALKAVVVEGTGERAFAAGADVTEFGGPEEARRVAATFHRACAALESVPRPVIAAVRGYCLGGGLELALGCDLRVAADDARLGQPEILLGIIPGGGGTQRLPRLVGTARAKEIIWTGRQVAAEEALRIGLVDRVETSSRVPEAARAWAAELGEGAVVAMGLAKRAVRAGLDRPLEEGLHHEAEAFAEVFETEDAATGIRSFLERGPGRARFSGR